MLVSKKIGLVSRDHYWDGARQISDTSCRGVMSCSHKFTHQLSPHIVRPCTVVSLRAIPHSHVCIDVRRLEVPPKASWKDLSQIFQIMRFALKRLIWKMFLLEAVQTGELFEREVETADFLCFQYITRIVGREKFQNKILCVSSCAANT